MIGDLVLGGVVLVAVAFACLIAYGIGYDHGRRANEPRRLRPSDVGKWVTLERNDEPLVVKIPGAGRHVVPDGSTVIVKDEDGKWTVTVLPPDA